MNESGHLTVVKFILFEVSTLMMMVTDLKWQCIHSKSKDEFITATIITLKRNKLSCLR